MRSGGSRFERRERGTPRGYTRSVPGYRRRRGGPAAHTRPRVPMASFTSEYHAAARGLRDSLPSNLGEIVSALHGRTEPQLLRLYTDRDGALDLFGGEEGQGARLTAEACLPFDDDERRSLLGWEMSRIVPLSCGVVVPKVPLLLPDAEAAALAAVGGTGPVVQPFAEYVMKLNSSWLKNWSRRWLMADLPCGLQYFKRHDMRKGPSLTIKLGDITNVAPSNPEASAKVKLKAESFTVTVRDAQHVFSSDVGTPAATWCAHVATLVLVDAAMHKRGLERVRRFVEAGANINATPDDDRRYPPIALSLVGVPETSPNKYEVTKYLLQRGAAPGCLLRWSFIHVDRVLTPALVLRLLIETKQDLNVRGDDAHEWTLLHYLALEVDLPNVKQLLARVDAATVQAVTTLGDSPLTLALKRSAAAAGDSTKLENPPQEDLLQKLCLVLAERSDMEHVDRAGDTALHLAVRAGFAALASRLVALGAHVNRPGSDGDTPLHLAIKTSQLDLARLLASADGADLNLRDAERGDTALVLALKTGQEELGCFLLRHGATPHHGSRNWCGPHGESAVPDGSNNNGASVALPSARCEVDTPLHIAIKMEMATLAELMVECGADLGVADTLGRSVVQLALVHRMLPLVRCVVAQCSADGSTTLLTRVLDMKDKRTGDTSVVLALRCRQQELACMLLDAGVNADKQNFKGESALHVCAMLAVRERSRGWEARESLTLGILSGLLRRGANPCLTCGPLLRTPTHVVAAAEPGCAALNAARALLAHDPGLADLRDGEGDSVLCVAIKAANDELASLVVESGCILDAVNNAGDSALHMAVTKRRSAVVSLLLERGAYPSLWDRSGRCPLHIAASAGMDDVVELFVSMTGSHLNSRTESGLTAAMLATVNGHDGVLRALLSHDDVDLRLTTPTLHASLLHLAAQTWKERRYDPARTDNFRAVSTLLLALGENELSVPYADTDSRGLTASQACSILEGVSSNEDYAPPTEGPAVGSGIAESSAFSPLGPDCGHVPVADYPPEPPQPPTANPPPSLISTEETTSGIISGNANHSNDEAEYCQEELDEQELRFEDLAPEERDKLIAQVRQEALDTANEWLETQMGRAMLDRRRRSLLDKYVEGGRALSDLEAQSLVRQAFIRQHCDETISEVLATAG